MAQFSIRKQNTEKKKLNSTRYQNNKYIPHKAIKYIITNRYFCTMIETLVDVYEYLKKKTIITIEVGIHSI